MENLYKDISRCLAGNGRLKDLTKKYDISYQMILYNANKFIEQQKNDLKVDEYRNESEYGIRMTVEYHNKLVKMFN